MTKGIGKMVLVEQIRKPQLKQKARNGGQKKTIHNTPLHTTTHYHTATARNAIRRT